MLTLYGFSRVADKIVGSTRDMRAQWALEETGLPYRVRGLDFLAGDLNSEEYRRLNPFAQVPVIDDDGFVLSETGAVLLYIAEKAKKLVPSDLQGRAQVTRWCFAALNTVEPILLQIAAIDLAGDSDPTGKQRRPELVQSGNRKLGTLDAWLAEHQCLTGAEFTVADILMATVLRNIRSSGLLNEWRHVSEYRERCEARPAWQRTLDAYEKRLGANPGSAH
jgi:glutathione S-transferase